MSSPRRSPRIAKVLSTQVGVELQKLLKDNTQIKNTIPQFPPPLSPSTQVMYEGFDPIYLSGKI